MTKPRPSVGLEPTEAEFDLEANEEITKDAREQKSRLESLWLLRFDDADYEAAFVANVEVRVHPRTAYFFPGRDGGGGRTNQDARRVVPPSPQDGRKGARGMGNKNTQNYKNTASLCSPNGSPPNDFA